MVAPLGLARMVAPAMDTEVAVNDSGVAGLKFNVLLPASNVSEPVVLPSPPSVVPASTMTSDARLLAMFSVPSSTVVVPV